MPRRDGAARQRHPHAQLELRQRAACSGGLVQRIFLLQFEQILQRQTFCNGTRGFGQLTDAGV
jgi:hypothetical protein